MRTLNIATAAWCTAGLLWGSAALGNTAPPEALAASPAAGFAIEVVDPGPGDVGRHASLALDAAGRLVVAYYNATTGDLRGAVHDVTWSLVTVDATGDVGQYTSLAIDLADQKNITYYDATEGALKYAGWVAPVWEAALENVTSGSNDRGSHASLTTEPSGQLAVAFYDATTDDLLYAVKSGTWSMAAVDATGDVGQNASLAIDASGRKNVTYYDATEGALKYAGWVAPVWEATLENVTSGANDRGSHAILTTEPSGNLAVAFYDATTDDLLYAVKSGTWSIDAVDVTGDVGQNASLAIDASGRKNVTYYDATEGALKYAGWVAPVWEFTIEVIPCGPHDVGQFASAALDIHDNLHVAYYDKTIGSLMVARRGFAPSQVWVQELVDDSADVGQYLSFAIRPYFACASACSTYYFSYYDVTNTALKVAWGYPTDLTSVEDPPPASTLPKQFALYGGVPNPFNPATTLSFEMPEASLVRLTIYDAAGRRVRTLLERELPPGKHSFRWDGTDEHGRPVASGSYICRMEAGTFRGTSRMALIK